MSYSHEAIVIGAGHNGLTCACYLAKAGMKVLVLDQYPTIGGMTNTEELTLPGYWSDTHAFAYQLGNVSPVPAELDLQQHGFELLHPEVGYTHVFPDGRSVSVHRDIERTCASIARFSSRDAEVYRDRCARFAAQAEMFSTAINSPPPSPAQQMIAMEALPDGLDEYRFALQSMRAWARDGFEAEQSRSLVGTWCAHVGLSPDDAGGAAVAWSFTTLIQQFGNNVVKGGMRHLPLALKRCLENHGGEVRTHAKVAKIHVENQKAVALELSDGTPIDVRGLLVSGVDPQQLVLGLLGEQAVGPQITSKMRRYEPGESALVIYLALDGPVHYKAGAQADRSVYVHPAPSLDFFARQFQQSRGGLLPSHPFALICNDSACDASRAPAGKGLMKLVVQPVPYLIAGDAAGTLRGATWEAVKEAFADRVIDQLNADYIPDLRQRIVCRVVHSPVDLETLLPSSPRGTLMHGAFLPYQAGAMRPIAELGQYRSPIDNLYLCGSGSHPGGGVSMAPGRNAARVIHRDLGIGFPAS